MPPLPGAYNASFTVNLIAYGFDVRTSSYGEQTEANLTIRTVPWSQTYTVVVQGTATVSPPGTIGSKPITRTYRSLVYTETDYLNLRAQRGQIGLLVTPRQPVLQAVLTDCKRADMQDPNNPAGAQTIEVGFVMLQTP